MKERPWIDQRDTSSSHRFRDTHTIALRVKMINSHDRVKFKRVATARSSERSVIIYIDTHFDMRALSRFYRSIKNYSCI